MQNTEESQGFTLDFDLGLDFESNDDTSKNGAQSPSESEQQEPASTGLSSEKTQADIISELAEQADEVSESYKNTEKYAPFTERSGYRAQKESLQTPGSYRPQPIKEEDLNTPNTEQTIDVGKVGQVSKSKITVNSKKSVLFNKDEIGEKEENLDISGDYQFKRYVDGDDGVIKELTERSSKLRNEYRNDPLRATKIINLDIVMKAPDKYFNKFAEDVENGVNYCRPKITDEGKSELISNATSNPTDLEAQSEAYLVCSRHINDFLTRTARRGVEKEIVANLITNELLGFDVLDPLWHDTRVTEIVCNGPFDIQIEISGEMIKVPSLSFRNRNHLEMLLERLFSGVGKVLAQSTPQAKGRLHDKSRIFATHHSISPDGPNFNIRRHPHGFWTPGSLIERGAASEEIMTYIGNLIHKGASFIIAGGTSTGKTSMLNALSGFYPANARILTLEDNLELKPNPKKYLAAALETRPPSPNKPNDTGITMRDLVWGAMQMRPEVLIIGEVTDAAAYDLCQALNTGHAGASTFHANSSQLAITRVASLVAQSGLTTIEGAFDLISAAFDFVINVRHFPQDGSRRIFTIDEVGTDTYHGDGKLILPTHPIWKFDESGIDENGNIEGTWTQVGDISKERAERRMFDSQRTLSWEELEALSSLPEGYDKV